MGPLVLEGCFYELPELGLCSYNWFTGDEPVAGPGVSSEARKSPTNIQSVPAGLSLDLSDIYVSGAGRMRLPYTAARVSELLIKLLPGAGIVSYRMNILTPSFKGPFRAWDSRGGGGDTASSFPTKA